MHLCIVSLVNFKTKKSSREYHSSDRTFCNLLYHFFLFGSDKMITPAMIPTNPARSIPEKATCIKSTDIAVAVSGSTDANRLALEPPIRRTPSI